MGDITKFQAWWKEAYDAEEVWRRKARANRLMYVGKQWDALDLDILRKEGRPALTINKIFPLINFLQGYQIQNRQDITVINRKGSTKAEAEILTECIRHLIDTNSGDNEISSMFIDGIITGRGFISGLVSFDDDPINGDLLLQRFNPLQIYLDPKGERYDLSDCGYIIKSVWYTMDRLRAEFPSKADEIGRGYAESGEVQFRGYGEQDEYEKNSGGIGGLHDSQVLVKEIWYKTDAEVHYVLLPDGSVNAIRDEEQARALADSVPGSAIKTRRQDVLNLASIVGDVTLQDTERPFEEFNAYPFVGFFPYRMDKDEDIDDPFIGVIDNLVDLQKEVNKRRSQQLNIINTMAHSGWLNKQQAGAKSSELEHFGSSPGAVINYEEVPPIQITPKAPSQAHLLTEEKAATDMKETSGINPDLLGYRGERGEPGVVLQMRQQQGSIILEGMLNNLRRSQRILGSILVGLITKSGLYTAAEVSNIIDITSNPEKQMAVEALFINPDLKRFDVLVATQPTSPSQRQMNFYKMAEMAKSGLPIPPEVMVKAADLPYSDEILAYIQQMKAAQGAPAGPSLEGALGGEQAPPGV